ncbi:MAG: hypothetical protein JRF42_07195 [Deltaproteobacteria bacterium]|nr:hypothetical protein [Deltaproteobacteria bacterium]
MTGLLRANDQYRWTLQERGDASFNRYAIRCVRTLDEVLLEHRYGPRFIVAALPRVGHGHQQRRVLTQRVRAEPSGLRDFVALRLEETHADLIGV